MSLSLRSSKSLKNAEKRKFILKNGKVLLEKLITTCNGEYNPIRNFTAEELESATNNYDPGQVITKDMLYKLYKGFLQDRPISVMKFGDNLNTEAYYCFNCIGFASQMSHRNILKFIGCCLETKIPILVFEFVAYGTLADRIHDPCRSQLEPFLLKDRLKMAMEIANAVAYLHVGFSRPIVFRDIKPSTILLQEQDVAKFFDFCVSISIPEGETHVNDDDKVIGTFGFIAPEYISTGYCSEKSDVYSFGALLLELLTGKRISYSSCSEDGEVYFLQELVKKCFEDNNSFKEIVDPAIIEEDGLWPEKEQQLLSYTRLAIECLSQMKEDRPSMIQVAKRLTQLYRST